MMMHMPMFVLDNLFEHHDANVLSCPPASCRPSARASARSCIAPRSGASASQAQAQAKAPAQQPADTVKRASLRELSDSYLIWVDLPGLAREDICITVKDDVLLVAGQQKARTAGDNASPAVQAALRARPCRAVDIKIPLKSDAKLDGIHAKLTDGELTIIIPKRVPQHFSVPVLGGDEQPSASLSPAALPPAEPLELGKAEVAEVPKLAQAFAEGPSSSVDKPLSNVVAKLKEYKQKEEEASQAGSSASSAASKPSAAADPATDAHAPAAAEVQGPGSDGSWEDVSDEEREAERVAWRRKGPLPPSGPVLEEIANAQPEAPSTGQ